eukprot:9185719-Lingulodinium_polyedra.AAC.1
MLAGSRSRTTPGLPAAACACRLRATAQRRARRFRVPLVGPTPPPRWMVGIGAILRLWEFPV